MRPRIALALLCIALCAVCSTLCRAQAAQESAPLPTGKRLTPSPDSTSVGSFPAAMAVSPDGKWIAVTDAGFRERLSILSAADGRLVSQLTFDPQPGHDSDHTSLYFGLAFGPTVATVDGDIVPLYASRGPEDRVSVLHLNPQTGELTCPHIHIDDPSSLPKDAGSARPNFIAGLALSGNGRLCYAVHNETSKFTNYKGALAVLDTGSRKRIATVQTPGFPLAVAAVTRGPLANRKVYVSSERDGLVSDVDVQQPERPTITRNIATGAQPMALLLNAKQNRLFVANAGSDTVSVIDTATDRVLQTLSVRSSSRVPGMTPTGLALSPDEQRLYVTLGDLNAVGVIGLTRGHMGLQGFIPAGWYPTAVQPIDGGRSLLVANAKGGQVRNPNGKPVGPGGSWGQYIENIIEGTVQKIPTPDLASLTDLSQDVVANNLGSGGQRLPRTGIRHVIYIIKENRTYDQVLGDDPRGNGDPSLVLFGKDVTPNEHALADRFVLLDNFFCAGEVSADGWNWCTSGMGSEYAERNVPFNYSGRGRGYDMEGQTNGAPADLMGMRDVATAPGGYIWDDVAKKGLTYRNYGFFLAYSDYKDSDGALVVHANDPVERVLAGGHSDTSFLRFDTSYADSDAYTVYNCPAPKQILTFGAHSEPDRFAEWKREFDQYVKDRDLPAFEMVRFMRDHTAGTSAGVSTPRAMVADNDYSVGELVQAVSHSPYWKSTAIFVVEDDAQDGYDHVDAHRSTAFVISPCIPAGTVDHRFYNTDSILRTMEELLGLPPMCQYDAIATPIQAFVSDPANSAPYEAVLPARRIIAQVGKPSDYGAKQSAMMDFSLPDQAPEAELNRILWHSIKGAQPPAGLAEK